MFTNLLKSFIADLFFNSFFERMLTKDAIWEEFVENKKIGASETVVNLISDVVNLLGQIFHKASQSTNLEVRSKRI